MDCTWPAILSTVDGPRDCGEFLCYQPKALLLLGSSAFHNMSKEWEQVGWVLNTAVLLQRMLQTPEAAKDG